MTTNSRELSMSELETFTRCHRKWKYRYGLGLKPKGSPDYMLIGSGFHAGAAEGYRHYNLDREHFLEHAHRGFAQWLTTDDAAGFSVENIPLVEDMLSFWWENQGRFQEYAEVIATEEHYPLKNFYGYNIRCTQDLIARRADSNRLVLLDHKTVGSVTDSLTFLPLDFQLRLYALSLWEEFDEIPEIDYNMIRRELPPNFTRTNGEKPYGLTPTGRPSTRTCEVDKYLRLERQVFNERQLKAFSEELEDTILDLDEAIRTGRFSRSVIRTGSSACGTCPYLAGCTRELNGQQLDAITLSLEFNREEPLIAA